VTAEGEFMRRCQKRATVAGRRLLRNNSGVLPDKRGIPVRFGVGSPGGSDLLGWAPVVITADMVGRTIAVFSAVETKAKGKATPEQLHFISVVRAAGGFAGVCKTDDEFDAIFSVDKLARW